jgi:steroid delta-isomerase
VIDPGRAWAEGFERLAPDTLDELLELAHPDIRFADPFHDIVGREALRDLFESMFASLREPRFRVLDRAGDRRRQFLLWRFEAEHPRLGRLAFEGTSRVLFDADGRVREHLDFWDASSAVFERVPLLGRLVRGLRRRAGARPEAEAWGPAPSRRRA